MAISGFHHIALSTNNMKVQLEFFTQVLGMRLVGLFPMIGAEGTSHAFVEAGKNCYLSFVDVEGVSIDPVFGVSHAKDVVSPVAGGAMQHLALNVDTVGEMFDLRDRLRSHGYMVFGPLAHESNHSMYFSGPEGILLEVATNERTSGFCAEMFVEAETATLLGMSANELARYISPPKFLPQGGKVAQPDSSTSVYPSVPRPLFDAMGHLSDEELAKVVTLPAPPGADTAHR